MLTQTARACASIHSAPGHEHSCLQRSRGGECGSMKRGAGAEKHRRGGGQSKTRRENKEEGDRGFPEGTAVPFFPSSTENPHGSLGVQCRPSAQPPARLRPQSGRPQPCWELLLLLINAEFKLLPHLPPRGQRQSTPSVLGLFQGPLFPLGCPLQSGAARVPPPAPTPSHFQDPCKAAHNWFTSSRSGLRTGCPIGHPRSYWHKAEIEGKQRAQKTHVRTRRESPENV